MLRKTSLVAVLCIAVAACGPQGDEPASTHSATPGDAPSAGKVVLAGGYTLPFEVRLRSQRHEVSAGRFRHVVAAEFKDTDAKSASDNLSADLGRKGYTMDPPADHHGGMRFGARGKDGVHMTIDVYGPAATTLKYPGSQGLVYATWVDHVRR